MTASSQDQLLSQVRKAGRYRVLPYEPTRASEFRLMDMGVCPGIYLEWVRSALLGDPVVIQVEGVALSVRRQDFGTIRVVSVS